MDFTESVCWLDASLSTIFYFSTIIPYLPLVSAFKPSYISINKPQLSSNSHCRLLFFSTQTFQMQPTKKKKTKIVDSVLSKTFLFCMNDIGFNENSGVYLSVYNYNLVTSIWSCIIFWCWNYAVSCFSRMTSFEILWNPFFFFG